jgi:CRISPR/Cas system-associated endonuclease Cas1
MLEKSFYADEETRRETAKRLAEAKRLEQSKKRKEVGRLKEIVERVNSLTATTEELMNVGLAYCEGKFLKRDYAKAEHCFEKAGAQW